MTDAQTLIAATLKDIIASIPEITLIGERFELGRKYIDVKMTDGSKFCFTIKHDGKVSRCRALLMSDRPEDRACTV